MENRGEFVGAFRENVIRVIGSYSAKNVPTEYDGQIEKLQAEMLSWPFSPYGSAYAQAVLYLVPTMASALRRSSLRTNRGQGNRPGLYQESYARKILDTSSGARTAAWLLRKRPWRISNELAAAQIKLITSEIF